MVNFTDVNSRAMLVSLHISTWSARKYDKKVSDKVTNENAAAKDAGRFNKHLLAGSDAHKAVMEAAQKARELHYRETLPWADAGERLLPTANYFIYMEKIGAALRTLDSAIDAFVAAYPHLLADAPAKLGGLFKAEEFPVISELRAKFEHDIQVKPVPGAGDIRLDLPVDQIEAIERQIQARVEAATRGAMHDAWDRLREAVERIHKAAGEDGIVRSTLIENAQLVCDTLKRLNIAQDEQLDAMRARVEQELSTIAVEDLRSDKRLRADTERRAADILAAMGGLYGTKASAA